MQTNLKEKSNFFERLSQIIDYYNIGNVNKLAKDYLNYNSSEKLNRLKDASKNPSLNIIVDISNRFEEINLVWLVKGEGSMLKHENSNNVEEPITNYGEDKKELILQLKLANEKIAFLEKFIDEKIDKIMDRIELKVKK